MTLLLLTIGVLIGGVLGLTGAGGSVLAVPLLVLLLHLDPASATGLALGVVAAGSIYGSIQRVRHREVLWIPAILLGLCGVVVAPIGRILTAQVSPTFLLVSFSVLSVAIAARMLWVMEWKTTVRSIVAPIAPNRKVSRRCATAPERSRVDNR